MTSLIGNPIDILNHAEDNSLFEAAYDLFLNSMINKSNRPDLFGKFIFINEKREINDKENGFWHVVSIGEEDYKYDMFPCQNHIAHEHCVYQCDPEHSDNYLKEHYSIPCIFRGHKINWIKSIIQLANEDKEHENLRIWQNKHKKTREKRLLIRYVNHPIDYVLIFSIAYTSKRDDIKFYKLITAYPVVLKSYKKRFDREYNDFIQKK